MQGVYITKPEGVYRIWQEWLLLYTVQTFVANEPDAAFCLWMQAASSDKLLVVYFCMPLDAGAKQ